MRLFRRALAALLALLLPAAAAEAACAGRDLMAELAASDPAAHAALLERGAAEENGTGKLWQVSREGVQPSTILGTYHDTGIATEPLPAAAVYALDRARALVVEISPEEQRKLQNRIATDPTFAFSETPAEWLELLTEEQRRMAAEALEARGLTLEAASHMRPWMLMSVLGVPQCQLAEMATGKPVLDTLIVQRAEEKGIPVLGLEAYTAALSAFGRIDIRSLGDLTLDLLGQVENEEDVRASMMQLYREGEIGAILEFGIWASARAAGDEDARRIAGMFREAIITQRNRDWMDGLEAELERGNTFVAFGALHLIGEEGVLALLEDRGWEVLRLDG